MGSGPWRSALSLGLGGTDGGAGTPEGLLCPGTVGDICSVHKHGVGVLRRPRPDRSLAHFADENIGAEWPRGVLWCSVRRWGALGPWLHTWHQGSAV